LLEESPDLFNPLWINITFSFTLCVCSNFSHYLQLDDDYMADFDFSYKTVSQAFALIFAAAFFVPTFFFFILICSGLEFKVKNLGK
jgi:small basic protein